MKKINAAIRTKHTKKMGFSLRIMTFAVFSMLSLSACGQMILQGDVKRGEGLSGVCGMCHGVNGISNVPVYPNLAGQKEQYLVIQLKAFRAGERVNIAMTSHAQKLSDQDIADLSAYYAKLDPKPE
ncbi:MAG: cytochrome c553 [Glaciecola sp.]|jgi:cytochrome c553